MSNLTPEDQKLAELHGMVAVLGALTVRDIADIQSDREALWLEACERYAERDAW